MTPAEKSGVGWRTTAALLVVGLFAGTAACDGGPQTVLEAHTVELEATPAAAPDPVSNEVPTSSSPSPGPNPTVEVPLSATPESATGVSNAPEPTPTAELSAREFLDSLAGEFHFLLAEELARLVEISAEWNPGSDISIAVVLPDEAIHGYQDQESRIAASGVKPMWVAAALDTVGVEAASSLAHSALVLSDNYASGRVIDLAGGVDAVNSWTQNVAGLSKTRLEAWRFGDPERVAEDFLPERPLGNRTTMADLALFYVRLHKEELLGDDETAALRQWLLDTSDSLSWERDLDGVLLDRLPPLVAESSLNKSGWLPPKCCPWEYRLIIDGGIIILPDGNWFGLAIYNAWGEYFDLTGQWVALAACRIYAFVAQDASLVCEREGDGVHNPDIWPEAGTSPQ